MHIHLLGICGTFMGGLALLARALGHRVTGSDAGVYPPMSTLLAEQGITVTEGWDPAQLDPAPDLVIVGNALSRGNPAVEAVLDRGLPYTSGAQWLGEQVLAGRRVLAVAGTHGKTTTAAMLAWILDRAGLAPGFLIGGVPGNFPVSARLGDAPFFVVEADEYDTAFFDKRAKFVHYRPRTLVINNLEFDHADIYPDLAAIQRQFHHLVRTVPAGGLILAPVRDPAVAGVLEQGCWTPVEALGEEDGWSVAPAGAGWEVRWQGVPQGILELPLPGAHNAANALAAVAAARHAGVPPPAAIAALAEFRPPRRRLELRGEVAGVAVYDDFAHHPTAIRATLAAVGAQGGGGRLVAVLEPRSATMRRGVHQGALAEALLAADRVLFYAPPGLEWDPRPALAPLGDRARVFTSVADMVAALAAESAAGDRIVIMSNGGFEDIHGRLLAALEARA